MNTEDIVKLTHEALLALLKSRQAGLDLDEYTGPERRRMPRWPFPGQVEVRSAEDSESLPHFFDCRDLSDTGMGMCGEFHYPIGSVLELSVHLPEMTLYGRAVVRYCMRTPRGHMMGVEFLFES